MRRAAVVFSIALALAGCAARSKDAGQEARPRSPATGAGIGAESQGAEVPPQQPGFAQPPPPPAPGAAETGGSSASTPGAPSVALAQASTDLEAAQRELDVAAGDCRNACRALGSMDRAAGRVCTLLGGADDPQARCESAKRRLFDARDRVRRTCGQCPGGEPAVERDAPVPSMR